MAGPGEDLDNMTEQATGDAKRFASKAAGLASQGAKRVGKGALKTAGKFLLRFLAAIGPIGWIVLIVLILFFFLIVGFGAAFDFQLDERGSSGALSLDPALENPTVLSEDGVYTVAAMTESQAMIDAYYKYMACNSHQKLFIDSSGNEIWLSFNDADEASDFASLLDMYSKENYFYLSPYFIKMADELLHAEEFYYPEQIVKPVYSKVLPLKSDASKKYITALPLVDTGSELAKAIKDGKQAYAIDTVSSGDETNVEKRTSLPADASLKLLSESKSYESGSVTVNGVTGTMLTGQGSDKEPGVWDYGFGSVLQYEAAEKDKYIDCDFTSFEIHIHEIVETEVWNEETGEMEPSTEEVCNNTVRTISISPSDTAASLQAKINAYETETSTVASSPSYDVLAKMTNRTANQHIEMKIQPEDSTLARRQFSNETLNDAFGNKGKTLYPLKIAVVSAAATFSGNLRYEYDTQKISQELRNEVGDSGFYTDFNDNYSQLIYSGSDSNCSGQALTVSRSGLIWDVQPASVPTEYSEPVGFEYLESYASHYQIYVPDTIRTDMDFQDRINQKQPGSYQSSLDANKDGELTVLDFLLNLGLLKPYAGMNLTSTSGGGYTAGTADVGEQELLSQVGVGNSAEGDVELLAKVIAAEAGPNKLDQLMVAAVVMNRVYDSRFPNTLIGVITAPGQYESWSNGSIQRKIPSEQMRSSARQVLDGEFALPANVLFQKGSETANGGAEGLVFSVVVNGRGYNNHTYSIPRADSAIAQTDRFGRTALSDAQARALAQQLQQSDVAAGYSTASASDTGILSSPTQNNVSIQLRDDVTYYAVTGFDLITALGNMQQLADPNGNTGFLHTLGSFVSNAFSSIFDQVKTFLNYMDDIWDNNAPNYYLQYNQNVPLENMRDIVYQAVTFADRVSYSATADSIDPDALVFLFIGKNSGIGMGTNGAFSNAYVNGVGSTLEGFTSPTSSYHQPLEQWSEATGSVTLAVPAGEVVQAVGDGRISSVSGNEDSGFTVTQTATKDGKTYRFVYTGLAEASVASGQSVEKGAQIGIAGAEGLKFSMFVDGKNVDPMSYFYQPSGGSSAAFMNILNSNGYVDEAAKNALLASLCAANDNSKYNGGVTDEVSSYSCLDKWHSNWLKHNVGECCWWAYGRGRQFAEEHGTSYVMNNGYGNGGDYYDRVQQAGDYKVGQTPRAGAWICWEKPGGYGHVGFVEAVEADGSIWVSESYRRLWDSHDGTGIALRKFVGPNYIYSAAYRFKGFIYLDQPLS